MTRTSLYPVAVFVLTAWSNSSFAAASLVVVNENTFYGDAVVAVHVAPSTVSGWGPNRLFGRLPVGENVEIDLRTFGDNICWFDILIVDDGAEEYEYYEINLCSESLLFFTESRN